MQAIIENPNDQEFSLLLKVRDYECDMQGIVNNSVYMNYLEHARHEYLDSIGLNFKKLTDDGVYLIAIKAELDYKKSLTPGEHFVVTCRLLPESRFKIKFLQEIYNERKEKVLTGLLTAAIIDENKKPILIENLINMVLPAFRKLFIQNNKNTAE
ncbi:MAG: hypothetical protein BGO43_08420 [Gammaproteobacteria bacterium 39-13]|nr:acyl-CoA thioesterase [Gammaproteobacteria bacterium]OJV96475.1 MAG: hypothetical protein BGO43_08420 [Gammaproteobacteria bacterium 39-13]